LHAAAIRVGALTVVTRKRCTVRASTCTKRKIICARRALDEKFACGTVAANRRRRA
jgi:hypothetical protein